MLTQAVPLRDAACIEGVFSLVTVCAECLVFIRVSSGFSCGSIQVGGTATSSCEMLYIMVIL